MNLNTEVSAKDILESKYDTVIIATGSKPKVFALGDDNRVYTAADVLLEKENPGDTTAVIGGGLVGCETALWLSQQGKKVTLIEALDSLLAINGPLCHANKDMLEKLVPYNGVDVVTGAKVTSFKDGKLTYETREGDFKKIDCDSVVLAIGYKEENDLYHQLEFEVPEIYLLGDAKKVSNIMYGIWDAFEVANHI